MSYRVFYFYRVSLVDVFWHKNFQNRSKNDHKSVKNPQLWSFIKCVFHWKWGYNLQIVEKTRLKSLSPTLNLLEHALRNAKTFRCSISCRCSISPAQIAVLQKIASAPRNNKNQPFLVKFKKFHNSWFSII